jgi:hypothetical protein
MFQNYGNRQYVSDAGSCGFETVITNGITAYYLLKGYPTALARFDQYWNYQYSISLPSYAFTFKFFQGNAWFSADNYIYKTDSTFTWVCTYPSNAAYRQMYISPITNYVYTAAAVKMEIHILDFSCSFVGSIPTGFKPYGLNYFNGKMYVGAANDNRILVLPNGLLGSTMGQYHINGPSGCTIMTSITFDSFGYMTLSCQQNNAVYLYDSSGNLLLGGSAITFSTVPLTASVDSSGRFIVNSETTTYILY